MSKDSDQDKSKKTRTNKSNDWMAAGIVILLLIFTVTKTPDTSTQNTLPDQTQPNNFEKIESVSLDADTQRVEQGTSIFDTGFLFLKRFYEKQR